MLIPSSTTINFGSVSKGDQVTKTVTLFNTGTSIVNVTEINSTSIDYVIAPTIFSINPNSSKSISIQYTSNTVANENATISIVNSAGPDIIILVSAIVLEPIVNIDIIDLDFGDIGNKDSLVLTKTITNTATNGSILNVEITSTDSNFVVLTSTLMIESNSSADISIRFNPQTSGSKTGTINLITNDTIGSYSFDVLGESVTPTFTIMPVSPIEFEDVAVNDSKTLTFEIENTSDVRLIISQITVSNSQFIIDPATSVIIEANASQIFAVSFSPLTSGDISCTITLINNTGTDIVINCTGAGNIAPILSVNVATLDYDIYPLNEGQTKQITISNRGVVDLNITSIDFPTVSNTTFSSSPVLPIIISPNTNIIFDINLESTDEVSFDTLLTIVSNSFNGDQNVDIIGEAQSPIIELDYSELDFGTNPVGTSRLLPITISNTNNVDLNVSISIPTNKPFSIDVSDENFTIIGGESRIVNVTFKLDTTGSSTCEMIITSNDIISPTVNVDLSGSTDLAYNITFSPNKIEKLEISRNITNTTALSLYNRSSVKVIINSFSFTRTTTGSTYTITTDTLPITLEAGSTVDININILASTVEEISGYLKFTADVSTISIQYSGNVYSPEIYSEPNSIDFDDVFIGSFAEDYIQIKNSDLHAILHSVLTCNNQKFKFKLSNTENHVATAYTQIVTPRITLSHTPVIPGTLTVTDISSGITLTQGDPASDPTKYSINTTTGLIKFHDSLLRSTISTAYSYTVDSISIDVSPESTQTVNVVFIPSTEGSQIGTITIASNDVVTQTSTINVSGTGLTAVTSIVQIGTLNEFITKVNVKTSQRAIIKNTGNVKLFVTNIAATAPFSVLENTFEIDPNETHELLINFTPLDESSFTQNIVIHSNAPDLTIAVEGQVASPIFSFESLIDFGTIAVNTKSSQTVSFSNSGLVDLNVQMEIQSEFFDINPKIVNIIPNNSYSFTVDFSPKEEKSYGEIIKITSDDPNHLNEIIDLTGSGINKPVISTATELQFPDTVYRDISQKILVITNDGTEDLEITDISVIEGGTDFRVNFTDQVIIAPQGSEDFTVEFRPVGLPPPKDGVMQFGKIRIENNDHNIDVNLRGFELSKEGMWASLQLQDIIPESVKSVTEGITKFTGTLKTILGLTKSLLNVVKIFLVDTPSALKIILTAIQTIIEKYLKDLNQSGIYMLRIFPSTNYIDPNMSTTFGSGSFGKFLASIGGGSEEFKQKVLDSFDDIYDGNRPQFSNDAGAGAVIIAIDSDKVADVINGINKLKEIFSKESYDRPEIQTPIDLLTISGKTESDTPRVTLKWTMPEFITFSIRNAFNKKPMIDMLEGFEIYRYEKQSQLYVSLDSKDSTRYNKVISKDTNEIQDPLDVVTASSFTKQLEQLGRSFAPWSESEPINGLMYAYDDKGSEKPLEFGKNYFYSIRTVMSEDVKSMLSNEVLASPTLTRFNDPSFTDKTLKRCMHFTCRKTQELSHDYPKLSKPIPKLIDVTGIVQQSKTTDKIAQTGEKSINVFTITLTNTMVDVTSVQIINLTMVQNQSVGKDKTRLALGFDMFITIEHNDTIIEIRDVTNMGYKENDELEVTYFKLENGINYKPECSKSKKEFDANLCSNGDILTSADPCPLYTCVTCQFNNGSNCTNVGYTKRGRDGNCVLNSSLYNFDRCIDGTMGGEVSWSDKQYRNSEHHCIETSGVCAGYVSVAENRIGQFPDWWSYRPLQVTPFINSLIKTMNTWVERELQAVQKGSQTVAEFIDLLSKKIEELEKFIDEIQKIIDWIDLVFSVNAGFYILDIGIADPKLGGVERIKNVIRTAEGGPNSDSNGYTAGIVILYGGPSTAGLKSFFKLLF